MIARLALAGDVPALAEIWSVSFPGDDAFAQWFLDNVFVPENALVWEEGGRAAGMLHLLPMRCQVSGQLVQAAYIFAVAVKPQHRGLGVAAGLLEEALRLSRERGAALAMLVPQTPSLFDYYRRQGFVTGLSRSERTLVAGQGGVAPGMTLDDKPGLSELDAYFNASLASRDHITRFPEHWERSMTYLRPLVVRKNGQIRGYAIYDPESGVAREFIATDESARAALASGVLDRLGVSEATAFGPDGPETPYGMIRPLVSGLTIQSCYANLMLD